MYCEQNFLRGALKVWAPVFPVKRAVLYTCHNWSWQNNRLAQRKWIVNFLQTLQGVLGDTTCTLLRWKKFHRWPWLVDLAGNSCVLHLDLLWTFAVQAEHVYHIKSVGCNQFFACSNARRTIIFYHMHCISVCENSKYTRNLTLIEKGWS